MDNKTDFYKFFPIPMPTDKREPVDPLLLAEKPTDPLPEDMAYKFVGYPSVGLHPGQVPGKTYACHGEWKIVPRQKMHYITYEGEHDILFLHGLLIPESYESELLFGFTNGGLLPRLDEYGDATIPDSANALWGIEVPKTRISYSLANEYTKLFQKEHGDNLSCVKKPWVYADEQLPTETFYCVTEKHKGHGYPCVYLEDLSSEVFTSCSVFHAQRYTTKDEASEIASSLSTEARRLYVCRVKYLSDNSYDKYVYPW